MNSPQSPGRQPLAPLYFLLVTILAQVIGFAVASASQAVVNNQVALVLIHSASSGAIALLLKLPVPWQVANLLLAPALAASLSTNFPAWPLGAIAAIITLLYLPTFWTRVPFYPTPLPVYDLVAGQLPAGKEFCFVDLGCGFGTMLFYLAKRFPKAQFLGVEVSPLAFLISKMRSIFATHRNLEVRLQSIWDLDLSQFDYVYAFLSPTPMPKLWQAARSQMRTGTTLIVNSFPLPTKEDRTLSSGEGRGATLFLYGM